MKSQACFSFRQPKSGVRNLVTSWGRYRHACDPPVSQIKYSHLLSTVAFVLITVLLILETLPFTVFSGMAAEEPEASASAKDHLIPLMVHLEQPLHFETPDGQNVTVSPGMYLVEPITQGESRLTFWNEHGTITVKASRTEHDQPTQTPEAHLIREDANKDILHVVVFLPDGIALEATCSVSGIRTRGDFRAARHYQLDSSTGVVRFGDGRQGRRLPTVQSNISAQYRDGTAARDGELEMIQLQSLMSQRQMAIALSTNLVNSLHGRFQLEKETDRPGDDYARYTEGSPDACRARCAGNENCQAFTFVKPNPGFTPGQCFLKRSEPKPATNHCCISGTRSSSQEKIIRNMGR